VSSPGKGCTNFDFSVQIFGVNFTQNFFTEKQLSQLDLNTVTPDAAY
jgi:hypothetical protein